MGWSELCRGRGGASCQHANRPNGLRMKAALAIRVKENCATVLRARVRRFDARAQNVENKSCVMAI
jgi:hypothetical protein